MAKKITPPVSPVIPYPGKRPDSMQDEDPVKLQEPPDDPDIIIDPDEENVPETPVEPSVPGEGP